MTKFELLVVQYLRWITIAIIFGVAALATRDFTRGLWTLMAVFAVFFLPTGETK